jgi:hypothetical protein
MKSSSGVKLLLAKPSKHVLKSIDRMDSLFGFSGTESYNICARLSLKPSGRQKET